MCVAPDVDANLFFSWKFEYDVNTGSYLMCESRVQHRIDFIIGKCYLAGNLSLLIFFYII